MQQQPLISGLSHPTTTDVLNAPYRCSNGSDGSAKANKEGDNERPPNKSNSERNEDDLPPPPAGGDVPMPPPPPQGQWKLQKLVTDNERLKLALERQKQRQRSIISQKVTEALTAAAMASGGSGGGGGGGLHATKRPMTVSKRNEKGGYSMNPTGATLSTHKQQPYREEKEARRKRKKPPTGTFSPHHPLRRPRSPPRRPAPGQAREAAGPHIRCRRWSTKSMPILDNNRPTRLGGSPLSSSRGGDNDDDEAEGNTASSIATPSPSDSSLPLTVTDPSPDHTDLFSSALNPRGAQPLARPEEGDSASTKPGVRAREPQHREKRRGGEAAATTSLFSYSPSSTTATTNNNSRHHRAVFAPFLYQIPRTPAEALANEAKLLQSVRLLRRKNAALQSRLSLVDRLLSNLHCAQEKDRTQHAHASELSKRRARDMAKELEDCQATRFALEERAVNAEAEVACLLDALSKKEAALAEAKEGEALRLADRLSQAKEAFEQERRRATVSHGNAWRRRSKETVNLMRRYELLKGEADESVKAAMDVAQKAEAALADERRRFKALSETHRASEQLARAERKSRSPSGADEVQLAQEQDKFEKAATAMDQLTTQVATLEQGARGAGRRRAHHERPALRGVTAGADAEEKEALQARLEAQTRIMQTALSTLQEEKEKECLALSRQLGEKLAKKYDASRIQFLAYWSEVAAATFSSTANTATTTANRRREDKEADAGRRKHREEEEGGGEVLDRPNPTTDSALTLERS
ncbi:uncharacterized protein LOC126767170 [Bactrocera neohumeralis]|uniref:uncharacterized protein LOC126767170 n=1 Tax=Bactrocera neohumeralis TaxID=98809 RepID=UPI002165B7D6|nr:uncharacterized protein LOC126767170 [Bactrocera neohumeralis]